MEGARTHAGRCYVLNHEVCRPGSRLGEAIGCADENVGEVDALREAGGYFALFCGHDHKNSFVGHVHDIDLGYAPTCGFECYGPKSRYRGIRLFEFHESNPAGYVTRMLTWGKSGRPLLQQRAARLVRGSLRYRSGQRTQRAAPPAGVRRGGRRDEPWLYSHHPFADQGRALNLLKQAHPATGRAIRVAQPGMAGIGPDGSQSRCVLAHPDARHAAVCGA